MEDLTSCFDDPCIIDIKIGFTYPKFTDPDRAAAKKKREEANCPALSKVGFQVEVVFILNLSEIKVQSYSSSSAAKWEMLSLVKAGVEVLMKHKSALD